MKVYFDGGCRPNPGPMEVSAFARGQSFIRKDIGVGSNSVAEWLALIHAIEVAIEMGESEVTALGDSRLIIAQANGQKCRSAELLPHIERFRALAETIPTLKVRYIKRTQNLAGIALEKTHN